MKRIFALSLLLAGCGAPVIEVTQPAIRVETAAATDGRGSSNPMPGTPTPAEPRVSDPGASNPMPGAPTPEDTTVDNGGSNPMPGVSTRPGATYTR